MERNLRCTQSTQRTIPAVRSASYARSIIPTTTRIWNELPNDLRAEHSQKFFKKRLYAYAGINMSPSSYLSTGSKIGNRLHTRLRLNSSDLKDHRFKLGKSDSAKCSCGAATENSEHFLLICPLFRTEREELFERLTEILSENFQNIPRKKKIETLLNGPSRVMKVTRHDTAMAVQSYILKTRRFAC